MLDWKEYVKPLEEWIEEAKIKQQLYPGVHILMPISSQVLESIDMLLENYKSLRKQEEEKNAK